MEHRFETELRLPRPRTEVFAFFAAAGNLQKITPPELGFRIVTPQGVVIRQGSLLEYRLRLLGVPFTWVSRIVLWDPPHRFVDEQVRGPYKQWLHEHAFEEAGEGVTIIRDRLRYRLPLEPAGDLAFPLVRLQLARIFAYRRRAVSDLLLGAGAGPERSS